MEYSNPKLKIPRFRVKIVEKLDFIYAISFIFIIFWVLFFLNQPKDYTLLVLILFFLIALIKGVLQGSIQSYLKLLVYYERVVENIKKYNETNIAGRQTLIDDLICSLEELIDEIGICSDEEKGHPISGDILYKTLNSLIDSLIQIKHYLSSKVDSQEDEVLDKISTYLTSTYNQLREISNVQLLDLDKFSKDIRGYIKPQKVEQKERFLIKLDNYWRRKKYTFILKNIINEIYSNIQEIIPSQVIEFINRSIYEAARAIAAFSLYALLLFLFKIVNQELQVPIEPEYLSVINISLFAVSFYVVYHIRLLNITNP